MAKEKKLGEVMLLNVRASFAHVDRPEKDRKDRKSGDTIVGKYKITALMEKDTDQTDYNLKLIEDALWDQLDAKYGNKHPKYTADRRLVRDGDDSETDGYEGHWHMTASSTEAPKLITKKKDEDGLWIPARQGQIYSGCYVNVLASIWLYDDTDYGKRQMATLKAVQYVKKGAAFGNSGPVDVEEKFAGIEADEDDDDDDQEAYGRSRERDRDDRGGRSRGPDREGRRDREDDRGRGRDDRGSRDRDDDRRSSGRDRDERGSDRPSRERDRDEPRRTEDRGRDRDRDDRGSGRPKGRSSVI